MSRRTIAALVIGWLLGLGTAAITPDLIVQRRTVTGFQLDAHIRDGWYVIRRDENAWTIERPRLRLP